MKRLYLVRHAKSSWKNNRLADIDRPLNGRGKRNLPLMAGRLRDNGAGPSLIISSPAKRARKTAKGLARGLGYPKKRISTIASLYGAGVTTLLDVVTGLEDNLDEVILVGHNPGITDLACLLSGRAIANVPTCGIVALDFVVDSWRQASPATAEFLFFDYPKKNVG